jgi:hypothetical protein
MRARSLNRDDLTTLVSGFVVLDEPSFLERVNRARGRLTEEAKAVGGAISRTASERLPGVEKIARARPAAGAEPGVQQAALMAHLASAATYIPVIKTKFARLHEESAGLIAKGRASLHTAQAAFLVRQAAAFSALGPLLQRTKATASGIQMALPPLRVRRSGLAVACVVALVPLGALLLPWRNAVVSGPAVEAAAAVPAPAAPAEAPAVATDAAPTKSGSTKPGSWTEVRRPITQFNLESPELDRAQFQHRARRHPAGGREETMTWGNPAESRGFMALVVYRPGGEARTDRTLFVETARRAAFSGMSVVRFSAAQPQPTKFGDTEMADIQMSTGLVERACLAFRHVDLGGTLEITGWYCGALEKPAERATLTCLLDRLGLMSAGDDAALRALFARAELNRAKCAAAHGPGRKVTWLDGAAAAPRLKGVVVASTEQRGSIFR